MARSGMGASVSVEVDCSLYQFEDADILAAAREIVMTHRQTPEPDKGTGARDRWAKMDEAVDALASAVGIDLKTYDHPDWPPASTAASILTKEGLERLFNTPSYRRVPHG